MKKTIQVGKELKWTHGLLVVRTEGIYTDNYDTHYSHK